MNMNVYVNEQFPYLDFMDIRPGDRVVLKPNLVKEGKETDKNEWKCVVTSPELIRYVANYVCAVSYTHLTLPTIA